MKLGITSDHRGYKLKEQTIKELLKRDYEVIDFGTDSEESVDYPDFAFILAENVVKKRVDFGVAMCGSGAGMTIACNKVKGIRCANIVRKEVAETARNDDNINIVAIDENTSLEDAIDIIETFIHTPFSTIERYQRREKKIQRYEEANYVR